MSDDLKLQLILEAVNKTGVAFDALRKDVASAEDRLNSLVATGKTVSDRLSQSFKTLDIRSGFDISAEQKAVVAAFLQIKNSGTASAREIERAYDAARKKLDALGKEARGAGDEIASGMKRGRDGVGLLGGGISALAGRFLILELGITHIGRLLNKLVFDFNSTLETAELGIAAAFMTGGQYVDALSGKALEGRDALAAAKTEARTMMEQLQVANFTTIATLDQLVRAFQETLPVAMAKGFDTRQVKEFTAAMVQAAGAIGLSMDMLGEETRSMLTGAIDPRTSRIATVLGLRNEDIAQYQGNADALFSFLMGKLDAYKVAGLESQQTWAGVWSNTLDLFNQISAKVSEPLFEAVKAELLDIAESIVTIDQASGEIEWNPDFVAGIEGAKSAIEAVIAELYRMGMLIDKIGGTMTTLGAIATFGDWDAKMREWNAQLEARYNESDRKLQELANRSVGLNSDGTARVDTRANYVQRAPSGRDPAADAAAKKAEAAAKTAARAAAKKAEAAAKTAARAAAQLAEQWDKTRASMALDVEKLGLDRYQARIADLNAKARDLREQFGANAEIDTWLQAMIREVNSDKLTDTLAAAKGLAKEMADELREAAEQARATAEAERAARENALNLRLAEIDLAERAGLIDSGTAIRERLALNQELLELQEAHLAQLDKLKDASAWYAQADAVNATRRALVELNEELRRKTGSAGEGWDSGIDAYLAGLKSKFEQAEDLAMTTAKSMESAFSDVFFDAMEGKLKDFEDYFKSFAASINRAIADQLAQQAAGAITKNAGPWIGTAVSFIGSLFSGSGSAETMHTGGLVGDLPRYHSGGLMPDERLIVGQTGERMLSRKQNDQFERLLEKLDKGQGGAPAPQIVMNISTPDANSFRASSAQVAAQAASALNIAARRNG